MTDECIIRFKTYLEEREKSSATVEKYVRDVTAFLTFSGKEVSREAALSYKKHIAEHYKPRSVNSMLASLNAFFDFSGRQDCKVKNLRLQQSVYCPEERELSREEYVRLCSVAEKRGNRRLLLLLQTVCGTGIRVSELPFITAEAVRAGQADVSCKGKTRRIFIVPKLQKKLLAYAKQQKITAGPLFVTRSGKPLNRSNIWREMKGLCLAAGVSPTKVFPHNLRHLFARVFYAMEKDITKLADILGHASINTTRIYIISTGFEHRQRMEKMRLIL